MTGPNETALWNVTGINFGLVNGNTFTGIENLIGGDSADQFVISDGAGVAGSIDGGSGINNPALSATVVDTLDFSNFQTARTVEITNVDTIATDIGFNLTAVFSSSVAVDAAAAQNMVTVDDGTLFQVGETIIISDDDSPSEQLIIQNIAGNVLTLSGNLVSTFQTAQNAFVSAEKAGLGIDRVIGSGQVGVNDTLTVAPQDTAGVFVGGVFTLSSTFGDSFVCRKWRNSETGLRRVRTG